jgi:DNA-binding LacI/PurR family transcriptional regulator
VVLLDSFVNKKKKKFDHIGIGSYDGIREAIRNLLDRGKTRIGFIGDRYTNLSRYPIFVRVMNEYGITPDEHLIGIGDERFEEGGYSRMIEIIRSGHRPDGLFVSYDNMAIGVLKAMHEHGLRPIEDISVIGHDNIQGSFYTYDSLSTIEPPLGKMAALVVERLIDRIHGDRSRAIEKLLPARFIDRGTS